MTDWIPVISQLKSLVQVTFGDVEGARETQEKFSQRCPVVSQCRSLVEYAIFRDEESAKKTQSEQADMLSCAVDSVPVIGHVKGCVHHVCGDTEGGNKAIKASSRSTGVVAGGLGGLVVAGPVGAVAGGIAGGLIADTATTGIESAVKKEFTPSGQVALAKEISDKAKRKENFSGELFDMVMITVFDGLVGKAVADFAPSSVVECAQETIGGESLKVFLARGIN